MGNLKTANTSYPGTLDTVTTVVDSVDVPSASHVNGPTSAIIAIETELGVNPKGASATVAARLTTIEGSGYAEPSGVIKMYGGSSAPVGYLFCDGASVSRTTYAALYAVLGTTYGSADGNSFNVPDLRGRTPIGVGTGAGGGASGTGLPTGGSALTAISRASWKGEETHQLSVAELASHTHDLYTNNNNGNAGTGYPLNTQAYSYNNTYAIQSAGSNAAHNNTQPVMGVNFIVKT